MGEAKRRQLALGSGVAPAVHDADKYRGTLKIFQLYREDYQAMGRVANGRVTPAMIAAIKAAGVQDEYEAFQIARANLVDLLTYDVLQKQNFQFIPKRRGIGFQEWMADSGITHWAIMDETGEMVGITFKQGEDNLPS